jgi:hypothetical protein
MCSSAAQAGGTPVFTQQPADKNVFVGVNVLLSAQASSATDGDYQWRADGVAIPGATNSSFELFCVSLTQSGQVYTVVASNAFGACTSSPARLAVTIPDPDLAPHTWGVNSSVWNDEFAAWKFRGRTNTVLYVDLLDTSSGGLWGTGIYTDDSSISAAAYHSGVLPKGARATVRLRILGGLSSYTASDQNGVSSSSYGAWPGAFEVIGLAPTISRHPVSAVRMVGGTVEFRVEASGTGKLSYQWKHNGSPISGATSSTLSVFVKSAAQAGSYAAAVTDDNATTLSQHAILGVVGYRVAHPQVVDYDNLADLQPGDFRHIIVPGHIEGGWKAWGNGFYSTDTDLGLAAVHAGLINAGQTQVVTVVRMPRQPGFLSETNHGVTSLEYQNAYPALAFAGLPPNIVKDPISQGVPAGESRRLEVDASSTSPVSVQWRCDGQIIAGATSTSLQTSPSTAGSLTVYDAIVSTAGNPMPSLPAYVFGLSANPIAVTAANENEASAFLGATGFLVTTPLTGTVGSGWLWGTGVYTSDSPLGKAAVHAGLVTSGQAAMVQAYSIGTWSNFVASARNGIESFNFATTSGYVFVFPKGAPSNPIISMPSPGRLEITGGAGYACKVWASPTINPPQWSQVGAIALTNSPQPWSEAPNASVKTRFYRVSLSP